MLTDPYIILEIECAEFGETVSNKEVSDKEVSDKEVSDKEVSDKAVRKAYLRAIRLCPPEADAEAFQRIQAAYESIKTQRQRMERKLFHYIPPTPEDIIGQALTQANIKKISATDTGTDIKRKRPGLAIFKALLQTPTY